MEPQIMLTRVGALAAALATASGAEFQFTMNHDTNGYETTSGSVWSGGIYSGSPPQQRLVALHGSVPVPRPYSIRFDQSTNGYISDGGNDMYDAGNYIYTSYGSSQLRPYTTNFDRVSNPMFGSGGWYQMNIESSSMLLFTRNSGTANMQLWTNGNLGADGSGTRQVTTYSSGSVRGFRRTVCNAGDPAVHHMFVTIGSSVSQTVSTTTNSDYHRLNNIPRNAFVLYFLYASTGGYCGTAAEHTAVFNSLASFYNLAATDPNNPSIGPNTPVWVDQDLNISSTDTFKLADRTTGGSAFTMAMTLKADHMPTFSNIFTMTTASGNAGVSLDVYTFNAAAAGAVQAAATALLGSGRYSIRFDQSANGYISDGGNDMYDGGNYLRTNYCSISPYTDDFTKVMSNCFGGNSQGYYRMNIDTYSQVLYGHNGNPTSNMHFYISGNLGADGRGSVQQWNSYTYQNLRGFVKSVCNAGDPTINHMFIVEDSPSAYQYVYYRTSYDYNYLYNIAPQKKFMYFLYSTSGGTCVPSATHTSIFNLMARNFYVGYAVPGVSTAEFKVWTSPTVSSSLTTTSMDMQPSAVYQSITATADTNGQLNIYNNGARVGTCTTNCTSSTGAATQRGLTPPTASYRTMVGLASGLLLEHMVINDRTAYNSSMAARQLCHYRGTWNTTTGVCACDAGTSGQFCESCASGHAGDACQHSNHGTCTGHGAVQSDGTCLCGSSYVGARCQYSDALTCNGRGVAQEDGTCQCNNTSPTSGQAGACGAHCECDCSCATCTSHGSLFCVSCPINPSNQHVVVSPVPQSVIATVSGVCTAPCSATQFRNRTTGGCQDVTVCGPAEFVVSAPGAWADRVCNLSWTPPPNPCGGCPMGQYQTNTPCVPPTESLCMNCTVCGADEVMTSSCLLGQDRMCKPKIAMPNVTVGAAANAGIHNTGGNIVLLPGLSAGNSKGVFMNGTSMEIVQYLTMLQAHAAELERSVATNAEHN